MEIFHYMRRWKSPTRMVRDMDAMFFIFKLCDVRMRIAIPVLCSRTTSGVPFKKEVGFSGGSFIRGKSVKEELNWLMIGKYICNCVHILQFVWFHPTAHPYPKNSLQAIWYHNLIVHTSWGCYRRSILPFYLLSTFGYFWCWDESVFQEFVHELQSTTQSVVQGYDHVKLNCSQT